MSSAPEAVFLKYGQASEDLINTMEDLVNNYFTTNHIQRAVIYDVRIQNDKILFDCTLGKYFKIVKKCQDRFVIPPTGQSGSLRVPF